MDTTNSTAPEPHPSTESEAAPHACNGGWLTLGQIVLDPETGEETEEYALYLCRRCSEAAEEVVEESDVDRYYREYRAMGGPLTRAAWRRLWQLHLQHIESGRISPYEEELRL